MDADRSSRNAQLPAAMQHVAKLNDMCIIKSDTSCEKSALLVEKTAHTRVVVTLEVRCLGVLVPR